MCTRPRAGNGLRRVGTALLRLIDLVEDAGDELRKADEAERRVIEEVRRFCQELLAGWADGQVAKRADALDWTPGVLEEGKESKVEH